MEFLNLKHSIVNIEIFGNIYNLHPIGHRNEGYEIHEEMRHIWDMRDTRDMRFMKNIRDMRDIWDLRVMRKMMILLQIFTKCYWLTDWLTYRTDYRDAFASKKIVQTSRNFFSWLSAISFPQKRVDSLKVQFPEKQNNQTFK